MQRREAFYICKEALQTLICHIAAAVGRLTNPIYSKIAYSIKLRWMDCKELSALKPSLRFFRPWPVIALDLFEIQ